MCTEQYFLGPSLLRYRFYNWYGWSALIDKIMKDWDHRKQTWEIGLDLKGKFKQEKNRTLQKLIQLFYGTTVDHRGLYGDTTPINTYYIKQIYHTFPKAPYIFLVRDGRDVMAAYHRYNEVFDHLPTFDSRIGIWNLAFQHYEWLRRRTNVLTIKYENLVQEPSKVISVIYDFLGIENDNNWVNSVALDTGPDHFSGEHHSNITKPIFDSSIGKATEILDNKTFELATKKMKIGLTRLGYL